VEDRKSLHRMDHAGEPAPVSVQIAGTDPAMPRRRGALQRRPRRADSSTSTWAARPRRCCNVWAGSALLQDEALVARILAAVVGAVDVPVTLKIRTGWNRDNRNGVAIARIAQDSGIAALAVHGRTRADQYQGEAEYDTIAAIKQAISIPLLANGDVDSPHKAREVLRRTGADALMIGRAAQGRPWIFRELAHFLATGETLPPPSTRRCATSCSGTCATCTSSTAKRRRAHRAQAPGLVREGPPGERQLPRRGQPGRERRSAAAPDQRVFPGLGRGRRPPRGLKPTQPTQSTQPTPSTRRNTSAAATSSSTSKKGGLALSPRPMVAL
jgi:nifR3 family TIM-barrel protein